MNDVTTVAAGIALVCRTVPSARVPEIGTATPRQVWKMPDGDISALGYRLGDDYWMEWPRFASFRFQRGGASVTAFVEPGVNPAAVEDVWRRSVLPLVLVARGLEALHASAVVSKAGVVAFCAASGTGKSTLAYALRSRGFRQWADDAVAFDPAGDGPIAAIPLPYAVRLDSQSPAFVDHPAAGSQLAADRPGPLAAVCVIRRLAPESAGREAVDVAHLTGRAALMAVLPHAHVFDHEDLSRNRQMVDAYLTLVERVPVCAIAFRPGREAWPAVLDGVAACLGSPAHARVE